MANKDLRQAVRLLAAGDWQGAHQIVQEDEESRLACWAHGIVHIMEGDLPNARYWYRVAGRAFPPGPKVKDAISSEVAALSASLEA
jgi:hypothetical protein